MKTESRSKCHFKKFHFTCRRQNKKNKYILKMYQINNIELMEIVLPFFAFANNSSAFSVEFSATKCILSPWTLKNWDAFCWLRCEGANLQSSNSNPAGCNIQHRIRNYCLKSSFCYAKSLLHDETFGNAQWTWFICSVEKFRHAL